MCWVHFTALMPLAWTWKAIWSINRPCHLWAKVVSNIITGYNWLKWPLTSVDVSRPILGIQHRVTFRHHTVIPSGHPVTPCHHTVTPCRHLVTLVVTQSPLAITIISYPLVVIQLPNPPCCHQLSSAVTDLLPCRHSVTPCHQPVTPPSITS